MSAGLRSDIFAADGCVRANIRTQLYRVTFAPKCEHVITTKAVIERRAQSAEAAAEYCRTFLRLPQMDVVSVEEVTPDA